jgi:predicted nucleic acid-binding protein
MITAVLDTNVIVGAAIGSAQATAGRILDAYFDGKYRLAFSPTTSDELLHVLSLPMIRLRHGKAFNACYDPSARQHNQGFFSTYFLDFDLLSAVSESGSRV